MSSFDPFFERGAKKGIQSGLPDIPSIIYSIGFYGHNFQLLKKADQFDFLFVCTPTWFKSHQIAVAQELVDRCNVKVIFIRTKLDDSIINDRKTKPNSHDEGPSQI